MPEIIGDEVFLDTVEAAQFLHLSKGRIYQLIATDKTIPVHKIGSKILFEKKELTAWVMKQENK